MVQCLRVRVEGVGYLLVLSRAYGNVVYGVYLEIIFPDFRTKSSVVCSFSSLECRYIDPSHVPFLISEAHASGFVGVAFSGAYDLQCGC